MKFRIRELFVSGMIACILTFGIASSVMATDVIKATDVEPAAKKIQAVSLDEASASDEAATVEESGDILGIVAKKLNTEEDSDVDATSEDESEAHPILSDSPYHWFKYSNGDRGCKDQFGNIIKDDYAISDAGNLCYLNASGVLEIKENSAVASTFPKKGLQGDYVLSVPGVTGNQILLNLYMNDAVSAEPTALSYMMGANTYYFRPSLYDSLRETITLAQEKGVKVSVVLLLRGNDTLAAMGAMYVGLLSNNPNQFYAFNPDSEVVKAFFAFSAMYLSSGGYHVDHWILGNEVNMPNTYNFTGSLDAEDNAAIYAKTFAVCDQCIRLSDSTSSIYISLDNHWTDNMNGYGIPGRDYLNAFFLEMKHHYPDVKWNLAFHLYAPVLLQTSSIWRNPELNSDENDAKFITPANLSVLTDYVKNRISPDCRIILSEQGYDSHEGEHIQATGLAYCFAAAEDDPMVDAVIFRTLMDEGTEGFLDLALVDNANHEREAYAVYQAIETPAWDMLKQQYLSGIY